MMQDKRLERLYEGLTAKETATLVFSHLSRGNTAEADRIRELVSLKLCRVPDPEHVDHFERLRRFTLHYGLLRWRYEAHRRTAEGFLVRCHGDPDAEDDQHAQEWLEAWKLWDTRLVCLDTAVGSVCSGHGVDMADVRRLAGVDGPYQPEGVGEVDSKLVADMAETFSGLLEPTR